MFGCIDNNNNRRASSRWVNCHLIPVYFADMHSWNVEDVERSPLLYL